MLLLRLIPGTDTMAMASTDLMAMDTTDTGLMAMDTTERGLLMPSLLPMLLLLLLLPLMLMPGMDTTTERGLLRLRPSPLLMLLLRLIPGTDTMAMASTDLMAMDTGERSKKCDFCQTAAN